MHGKGFVHTDLKPQNIFFTTTPTPRVKLGDFGCTLTTQEVFTNLVDEGNQLLQPRYWRAPEVILGMHLKDLSRYNRLDIWSLGVIMLHMYTGKIVFRGAQNNHQLLKVIAELMPNGGGCFTRKILRKCSLSQEFFTSDVQHLLLQRRDNDRALPPTIPLHSLRSQKDISQLIKIGSNAKTTSNSKKLQLLTNAIIKCLVIDPQERESASGIVGSLMPKR